MLPQKSLANQVSHACLPSSLRQAIDYLKQNRIDEASDEIAGAKKLATRLAMPPEYGQLETLVRAAENLKFAVINYNLTLAQHGQKAQAGEQLLDYDSMLAITRAQSRAQKAFNCLIDYSKTATHTGALLTAWLALDALIPLWVHSTLIIGASHYQSGRMLIELAGDDALKTGEINRPQVADGLKKIECAMKWYDRAMQALNDAELHGIHITPNLHAVATTVAIMAANTAASWAERTEKRGMAQRYSMQAQKYENAKQQAGRPGV